MNGRYMLVLAVAAAVSAAGPARAQEEAEESGSAVSLTLDAASAYVFRGVAINPGPVVQPGMEVSGFPIPLTVGVWGNLDLDDGNLSEIDLYGSYSIPIDIVEVSVGYTEYTYPTAAGEVTLATDENGAVSGAAQEVLADREVTLGIGVDTLLSPSLSASYGLAGAIAGATYAELGLGHEFDAGAGFTVGLSGALGYLAAAGEAGFSHYTLSLDVGYGMASAGVSYVGAIEQEAEVPVVASIGVGYDF